MIVLSSSNLRFERRSVPNCNNRFKMRWVFLEKSCCDIPASWSTSSPSYPVKSLFSRRYKMIWSNQAHLRVPQQLHNPTLVRRESSNLPDNGADELGPCGCNTLTVAGLGGLVEGGGGMALVEADAEVCKIKGSFRQYHRQILRAA